VAPLKLNEPRCMTRKHRRFPRLQKRGPIEAHQRLSASASNREFPRLQKRGPIEALPPNVRLGE